MNINIPKSFVDFSSSNLKATSASFSVTAPTLGVSNIETDLVVTKGTSFSSTFYLVDAVSSVAILNPNYKVFILGF